MGVEMVNKHVYMLNWWWVVVGVVVRGWCIRLLFPSIKESDRHRHRHRYRYPSPKALIMEAGPVE